METQLNMEPPMLEVQEIVLKRAIAMLDATPAQYKVILPDGREFGTLEVAPPKMRASRVAMTHLYVPYLQDLQVSKSVVVPVGDADLPKLANTISSWACTHWGKGSTKVYRDHKNNAVQVTRIF